MNQQNAHEYLPLVQAIADGNIELRDWFAGQALAGLLAVVSGSKTDEAYFANHSYKIADAMLEARKTILELQKK